MVRHARAERLAAAQPIGEVPVAVCYGGGVIISGVERLPIHGAVNDHAVLCFPCCGLRRLALGEYLGNGAPKTGTSLRLSLVIGMRLRQKLAAARPGWRARSVAVSPACRD